MVRDEELFFHFLRLGLWGEEPDEPGYDMTGLTRDDWCRIYDMGHRQAVSGIVTDGIAHCGVRPDGELWGQWIAQLMYMERMKLTFQMEDLFRISTVKRERGLDYPFARTFNFGLQVQF